MRIITIADKKYEKILQISMYLNSLLPYQRSVYNLNNTLDYGIPFYNDYKIKDNEGKIPYKPLLIEKAIEENPDEKCIAYFDADAFAIRNFDEIEYEDFDVALTLSKPNEHDGQLKEWWGYINAGVIFIKPSIQTMKFLELWKNTIKISKYNSDQHALNLILLKHDNLIERNKTLNIDDIKIKLLETDIYNNYYKNIKENDSIKIVHYNNPNKDRFCIWTIQHLLNTYNRL